MLSEPVDAIPPDLMPHVRLAQMYRKFLDRVEEPWLGLIKFVLGFSAAVLIVYFLLKEVPPFAIAFYRDTVTPSSEQNPSELAILFERVRDAVWRDRAVFWRGVVGILAASLAGVNPADWLSHFEPRGPMNWASVRPKGSRTYWSPFHILPRLGMVAGFFCAACIPVYYALGVLNGHFLPFVARHVDRWVPDLASYALSGSTVNIVVAAIGGSVALLVWLQSEYPCAGLFSFGKGDAYVRECTRYGSRKPTFRDFLYTLDLWTGEPEEDSSFGWYMRASELELPGPPLEPYEVILARWERETEWRQWWEKQCGRVRERAEKEHEALQAEYESKKALAIANPPRRAACPQCGGAGKYHALATCSGCGGRGQIFRRVNLNMPNFPNEPPEYVSGNIVCPRCGGKGRAQEELECGKCRGRGKVAVVTHPMPDPPPPLAKLVRNHWPEVRKVIDGAFPAASPTAKQP